MLLSFRRQQWLIMASTASKQLTSQYLTSNLIPIEPRLLQCHHESSTNVKQLSAWVTARASALASAPASDMRRLERRRSRRTSTPRRRCTSSCRRTSGSCATGAAPCRRTARTARTADSRRSGRALALSAHGQCGRRVRARRNAPGVGCGVGPGLGAGVGCGVGAGLGSGVGTSGTVVGAIVEQRAAPASQMLLE